MDTTTLVLNGSPVDRAAIERAAAAIRAGGLVAFPTETVYGLGANALSPEAVRKIYAAKERSPDDPCIVHIAALADLARVVSMPDLAEPVARWAEALAQACWPGPLSLVLPRAATIPDEVTARRPTVAVRMPAHPVALALIRAAGVPIAAPSANLFMHTSPTTARHVRDDLDGRIDLILDGGPTPVGVESTVLAFIDDKPTLLRPGGVSVPRLETVLGIPVRIPQPTADPADSAEVGGLPAPGMLSRHYAPHAEVILLDGPATAVRAELARQARARIAAGKRVGALLPDEDAPNIEAACPGIAIARLGPGHDLEAIARRLYTAMRELEAANVEVILTRIIDDEGLGRAIRDRLLRAAGGRITHVGA